MQPVLIVEDHSINRDVALIILKSLGYPAEVATSGFEAVDAVRSKTFSLILMDVMMPDIDGYETCRRIRMIEEGTGARTPIVAISAWAARDNKEKCLAAGMDDYVSKPFTRDELKKVIDKWVSASAT